jgi:hydroxymethylglutaryl-CoA lyase
LSKFDSSAAGLGGCPYAAGASGNLATEDLVYLCDGLGIDTGIDFGKVVRASEATLDVIGIGNRSKSAQAWQAKKQT